MAVVLATVPAAHAPQDPDLFDGAKVPGAQSVHTALPALLNFPGTHENCVPDTVPAGQ